VVTVADGTLLDRETAASHDIVVRAISADGSFSTRTFTISLNDVDEFDVGPISDVDAAADAVDENAANGTAVGIAALAEDADATNNAIAYSLDDDAGGRFTINAATGVVTVADGTLLDRETAASHDIVVRAISADGSFSTRTFTISLNDVDEFDVGPISDVDAAADAVDENAANGTAVGIAALAEDADATNNAIAYSLDDDAGGRFTIDAATGVVTVADGTLLDRETAASHDITVRAISADGSFSTRIFTISLNDVDEFDVGPISDVDASADAVDENAANGTAVGITAFAEDADATNNAIGYSLDDDAGGRFAIDAASGVVTVADGTLLDRETAASHDITVRAASADGSFSTRTFTISLNDVDEFDVGPISDVDASADAVDENAANGTAVGITAFAEDADATNNAIDYSLDDNAGGRFAIDAASGVVTVADGTLLDRESAASHDITVRAISADGSFSTRTFTISVNPVNDHAPVITSDGGGATAAVSVVENHLAVTMVAATDADLPAQTLSYAIAGGADAAAFILDAATGELTFAVAPDFEAPGDADRDNVYEVIVQVDDGVGGTDSQTIFVTVTDVNDTAPVITANSLTITEGQTVVLSAADLNASDPDSSPAELSYTAGNVTGGRFAWASAPGAAITAFTQQQIDNGEVVFVHDGGEAAPTYEATVSDGVFSSGPQAAVVAFTNVNDAPLAQGDSFTVGNNAVLAIASPGLLANDADVDGDPLTARLLTGPASGTLTLQADGSFVYVPDVNQPGLVSFTYEAFDGAAVSQAVTVEIMVESVAAGAPPPSDSGVPAPPSDSDSEEENSYGPGDVANAGGARGRVALARHPCRELARTWRAEARRRRETRRRRGRSARGRLAGRRSACSVGSRVRQARQSRPRRSIG
jgi:hypothetical protein